MRNKMIAGNWKMNMTAEQTAAFFAEFRCDAKKTDVVLCVPFTDIAAAVRSAADGVKIGAQNVSWADKGAFTGEISADMLIEAGAEYVIIGHSERRAYFGETDESVNQRLKKAHEKGLKPIVCVGETLAEREDNLTEKVLFRQIERGLEGLSGDDVTRTVIAYEPVWAIGTGKTASPSDADATIAFIRKTVRDKFGCDVRILYGGSMNAANAAELLAMPNIDGGLIGGASLKPADFTQIILAAERV